MFCLGAVDLPTGRLFFLYQAVMAQKFIRLPGSENFRARPETDRKQIATQAGTRSSGDASAMATAKKIKRFNDSIPPAKEDDI
jgi:hypothetical protein